MPDYGTARADFPGGDARQLFKSIRRLLALPEETKIYLCHDYKALSVIDLSGKQQLARKSAAIYMFMTK